MAQNKDEICRYYDCVAEKAVFDERINMIECLKKNPKKLFSEANIVCLAHADAANTSLVDLREEPAVRVHKR